MQFTHCESVLVMHKQRETNVAKLLLTYDECDKDFEGVFHS